MAYSDLLDTLAACELTYAHFNARRTSATADIPIGLHEDARFRWLADASRLESAYYSRAIGKQVAAFSAEALLSLPRTVAAVELRPAEIQPDIVDALTSARFRPAGALCYLVRCPPAAPITVDRHRVRRLQAAQADEFLSLLALAGTPFPAERRAAKRSFYCTDEFQVFVAEDAGGAGVGWATLYRTDNAAFLGNAYTQPPARGRGIHAALLAARLNAASGIGVDHVFTDVEHGSQSHAHCEAVGFRTLTINTIWQRHRAVCASDAACG